MAEHAPIMSSDGTTIPHPVQRRLPANAPEVLDALIRVETNENQKVEFVLDRAEWQGYEPGPASKFARLDLLPGYADLASYADRITAIGAEWERVRVSLTEKFDGGTLDKRLTTGANEVRSKLVAAGQGLNSLEKKFLDAAVGSFEPSGAVATTAILVLEAFDKFPPADLLALGNMLARSRDPSWPLLAPAFRRVRRNPPGWWKGHENHLDVLLSHGGDELRDSMQLYANAVEFVNNVRREVRARISGVLKSL